MELSQEEAVREKIERLLHADRNTSSRMHEALFVVSPKVAAQIKKITGVDVAGYMHSIDRSELNHAINRHSSKKIEMSRGQLPIVGEDFFAIPEVVTHPDKIEGIGKDKLGRETIAFEKLMKDGNVIVYEAVLTGRKELAFQTLFKKKTGEFVLNSPTPTPETTSRYSFSKGTTFSSESQVLVQKNAPSPLLSQIMSATEDELRQRINNN